MQATSRLQYGRLFEACSSEMPECDPALRNHALLKLEGKAMHINYQICFVIFSFLLAVIALPILSSMATKLQWGSCNSRSYGEQTFREALYSMMSKCTAGSGLHLYLHAYVCIHSNLYVHGWLNHESRRPVHT